MTALQTVPLDGGKSLEELSPREISRVMIRIQRMRHARVEDLKNLTIAHAKAVKAAKTEYARAFLAHEGPVEERKQVAVKSAADLEFAADVAKASVDACKESMKILADDWDSTRSIGANERAEMELAGAGTP